MDGHRKGGIGENTTHSKSLQGESCRGRISRPRRARRGITQRGAATARRITQCGGGYCAAYHARKCPAGYHAV